MSDILAELTKRPVSSLTGQQVQYTYLDVLEWVRLDSLAP